MALTRTHKTELKKKILVVVILHLFILVSAPLTGRVQETVEEGS